MRAKDWDTARVRFEAKYIPEPNSGCWLWLGAQRAGYGQIRVGRTMYATRVSLALAGRPISRGLSACHHCDNTWCVNPDHLFAGNHKDNAQDASRKGRLKRRTDKPWLGENNGFSKLTDQAVRVIRASDKSGAYLAKQYDVSPTAISRVRLRRAWRHVV